MNWTGPAETNARVAALGLAGTELRELPGASVLHPVGNKQNRSKARLCTILRKYFAANEPGDIDLLPFSFRLLLATGRW